MVLPRFLKMLEEINAETGLKVHLDSGCKPEKDSQLNAAVGYTLIQDGDAFGRRLILIFDEGSYRFGEAKAKMRAEMIAFWDAGTFERCRATKIVY